MAAEQPAPRAKITVANNTVVIENMHFPAPVRVVGEGVTFLNCSFSGTFSRPKATKGNP